MWKKFKFSNSYFLLPVYFLVLAVSPNISGERIGLVLLSVYVLLIPAAYYIALNPGKMMSDEGGTKFGLADIIALVMFLAALNFGWSINWEFNLLQVLLISFIIFIEHNVDKMNTGLWSSVITIYGILIYALLYIGINQYSFAELATINNMLLALFSAIIIRATFFVNELSNDPIKGRSKGLALTYLVFLLVGGGIIFYVRGHWQYIFIFLASLVLPAVLLVRLKKSAITTKQATLINWVLSTCQILFFLYYFLDSTQVLQAIQGGY